MEELQVNLAPYDVNKVVYWCWCECNYKAGTNKFSGSIILIIKIRTYKVMMLVIQNLINQLRHFK
ncbi:hypothetical protein CS542_08780 [Pedobacter sp. IW39]|nr:hypothetical protein CS542_08780 [Pedobacter sp. IW39]